MSPALQRLARALNRPPEQLSAFAELAEPELARLADAIERAERRQAAELETAIANAIAHLPLLLRGPVQRLLGGDRP